MRRIILVASVFLFLGLSTLTAQTQKMYNQVQFIQGRLLVQKIQGCLSKLDLSYG